MDVRTAGWTGALDEPNLKRVAETLTKGLKAPPDWVVAFPSASDPSPAMAEQLAKLFPEARLTGCTACQCSLSEQGVHGMSDSGVTMFALSDPDGAYGVGWADFDGDPAAAAKRALDMALSDADRVGELPDVVWMHASPGHEEVIIPTLNASLGEQVPILGGAAADADFSGKWLSFAGSRHVADGLTISVLFPSTPLSFSFQCGHEPTGHAGLVTKAEGRLLHQIDGRPAAEVYNEWVSRLESVNEVNGDSNLALQTTFYPLGIEAGSIALPSRPPIPYFALRQPSEFMADGSMSLHGGVEEGQALQLMRGTVDSLLARAGQVASDSLEQGCILPDHIAGAIGVSCASNLFLSGDRLKELQSNLASGLHQKPFAMPFTFGEQGFACGKNLHGNIMTLVLTFSK